MFTDSTSPGSKALDFGQLVFGQDPASVLNYAYYVTMLWRTTDNFRCGEPSPMLWKETGSDVRAVGLQFEDMNHDETSPA